MLPAHSTHLTQPADVGAFQKLKFEFKAKLRHHVFIGEDEVSKADFFAIFQGFSNATWSEKLCRSAFRKTGLIPYNPQIVLDQINTYGKPIEKTLEPKDLDEEPAFGTPPPRPISEFTTPITFTGRKRGADYIDIRLANGPFPLTPTFKRVKLKVDKYTDRELNSGLFAKSHLKSVLAYQKVTKDRNKKGGQII